MISTPSRVARRLAAVGLAATAVVIAGCDRPEPPAGYVCRDCNVVLISMDTLRADHVGAYGYDRPTTPVVDELAARAVLFENAISQSSWTRPAHMSMFTGLYPAEHGYLALVNRRPLADTVPTLASVLRDRGYATVAFTGGINMAPAFGFDSGFDLYRVNGRYYRNSIEEARYWLDEIDKKGAERFFMFFHAYDPHTPYHSDPIAREALGLAKAPPGKGYRRACKNERAGPRIRRYIDEYDAAIRSGDRYVGKLIEHLDSLGLLDRTLIVFTSDHGEEFLEHGRCFHLSTLYREVLHVPLMIVAPAGPVGRIESLVPASVSIGPTILDLVGGTDHTLPGPSLAGFLGGVPPHFEHVQSETSRREYEGRGEGHVRALTGEHEKIIEWVSRGERLYYDLGTDPGELSPIESGRARDRMYEALAQWVGRHPPRKVHGAANPEDSSELDRQLRSLGYQD